ncbi:MAG: hypothetical protein JNJ57_22150 [Saprospiraceae bacterium]|nr:hypothetical protein [Saprospiraceae bacterium]
MENFDQPLDVGMAPGSESGLQITDEIKMYWQETRKWALFFGIMLFVFFGLVSLVGLLALFSGTAGGFVGGVFVIGMYVGILFFPALYYYRFSTQMKQALNDGDNSMLEQSFINLRRYYVYVGILVIIVVAIYLIFFIVYGSALMRMGSM